MKLKIDFIDAFTDTVFKGNSAGVVVLKDTNGQSQKQDSESGWLDTDLMQSIATQNNLSETAFLVCKNHSDKSAYTETTPLYHIRWFSTLMEVDFCGHATLASAFVLFDKDNDLAEVQFYADAVGVLTVTKRNDGKIQMDFPNQKPKRIMDLPKALVDGLSIKPVEVYQNQKAYFVIYEQVSDVLKAEQDKKLLAELAPHGVAVTSQAQTSCNSN
ncbi:PhzF family phenazine biosynthesis protein [Psychrobacter sp. FDAARGOS_221]|uniref:PhzF family phenazine biosynthesis protein n=1 Tax=Psychrobacter sp. FDAARGOS_221 TaxID=1975705 RepID=UPI000BB5345C|nr:PhzF family phenazine biosynthesis protein [Psychrobacter sp. FDAARGOS_221]PNK59808.1 PhzF family phenazine biosynthesis protein [Psychrobacter sp. FDAARGOS_221]